MLQPPILRVTPPQRGIATLIALIALLIMTIAVLALVRSSDTSSLIAGNFAFRRDLANQGQLALSQARTAFTTGALNTESLRQADLATANYSSTMLPPPTANPSQGIPAVLLSDTAFTAANFTSANDIADNNVTVRYVIDRLCTAPGPPTAATCAQGQQTSDLGGTSGAPKAGGIFIPTYRITIRVTGPHNAQAFFQSTLVD